MNELSKANEWEFWDYDISASSALHPNDEPKSEGCSCNDDGSSADCNISHILPSHIEVVESSSYEEDYIDKAWREFDSWESILRSTSTSNQSQANQALKVMSDGKPKSQATNKIQETTSIQGGRKKTLDSSRGKSRSPGLNDVKSNCKGARAA